MDLVNFRRLGKEAEEITKKIEEKINFLEDESYAKRMEGIRAWRNSPVNKLYLDIGRESIEKNKKIEDISAQMKDLGKGYLTIDEFNAIMNLNKRLRY
jgi:6-phosphogluconate dehydrogenase (decarboxylating)